MSIALENACTCTDGNAHVRGQVPWCRIDDESAEAPELVNHPPHYTSHPSGVECIQVTEHMNFNVGNAVKYLWRADEKGAPLDDLRKARWYVDREIARREALGVSP